MVNKIVPILILVSMALCAPLFVSAASTGPRSGGTFVSDSSIGVVPWTTPTSAASSDDSYARSVSLLMALMTQYLKATGFGFSIPANAVIEGIQVDVERSTTLVGANDAAVRIVKGGAIGTADHSSGTTWPTADTYISYGGAADLWGQSWTPSDINDPSFGVALAANAFLGVTANVDTVRITVFYNSAPLVAAFSAAPDPVQAGSDVTFNATVSDTEGDQVKVLFCKTNSVTPSSSGGSCPGGAWAATDLTSATARIATYTTQVSDAPVITYFAFACDGRSTCSPAAGNTASVTVQTESTGDDGGGGGNGGGSVTVPVNIQVSTPAPQPTPTPSVASTSSSPTSISISISGLGTSQTTGVPSATTTNPSTSIAKILNTETQLAPGSALNLLFQTEPGLTGDTRPAFSLYDPDFVKRITAQPMSETSSGVYTSRVVFDPAWGTGAFVFIATGYPTNAKDAFSIRVEKPLPAIVPSQTSISVTNVSSTGSGQGGCDIDEIIQAIATLRASSQVDTDVKIQSLQPIARSVADCARASKRSPMLSTYAAEQESNARSLESIVDEATRMTSTRNVTEVIRAAASTTKTLMQNKKTKRPIVNIFWTSGSVVMNFLITNPEDSLETSVDIRAPLPPGITREHILATPEGLHIEYDPTISRYVLMGTLSIPKGASSNLVLEFKDIWSIPENELDALNQKAQGLYDTLIGSNYAAEALALRDKIEDEVHDVRVRQENALSPDEKSAIQRENNLAIVRAEAYLMDLGRLVERHNRDVLIRTVAGVGIALLILLLAYALWRRFGVALEGISQKNASLSFASHELRSPLTLIRGILERLTLEVGSSLSQKQRAYLEDASRSSARMADIIRDFLTASKLELGTLPVSAKPTNLALIAADICKDADPTISKKKITLKQDFEKDVPEIVSDPDLIRIILQNLISNAVKYTPEGGSVHVTLGRTTDRVTLSVSDTGIGIPVKDKDRVFEKMFRSDNAKQSGIEGTGLGLYITKRMVERLAGEISLDSQEGKGATFLVKLPLAIS